MYLFLLIIIYISFISLGLPDTLLGATWPTMCRDLEVPFSYAGHLSIMIACGIILSSLMSDYLTKKFGAGKVTAFSVLSTAIAMLGFGLSHSYWQLCLWTIPYGLGAGSVDAALNNFVALHYKAKHMNWLHCFWGIGATTGPFIMGMLLVNGFEWNDGYMTMFVLQISLTAVLMFSLPKWKKASETETATPEDRQSIKFRKLISLPGAKAALLTFFCYIALEGSTGLWGSTYMVNIRGVSPEHATQASTLFFLGITVGRFLSGFVSMRLNNKNMVRLGQGIAFIGALLLLFPLGISMGYVAYIFIGLGCAPIFPSLLHATPDHFGKNLSQAVMGMQMACATAGGTIVPPIIGYIGQHISMHLFPVCLFTALLVMMLSAERLNKVHTNS